jgi:CheY-like chemotaxis protein
MPEQTQPAQIPKKILLVEDTVQLREALERYLKQEGLQVISAVDGEEGLAKAREFTPDFILTDIFMPRLGGIDMIKQIRITEWGRDIPVILLSNFSLDRDSLQWKCFTGIASRISSLQTLLAILLLPQIQFLK